MWSTPQQKTEAIKAWRGIRDAYFEYIQEIKKIQTKKHTIIKKMLSVKTATQIKTITKRLHKDE